VPKALLDFMGYTFYFYSKEGGEPIHIHVSKGKPSTNSTKFWIKRDGVVLEHNNGGIPNNDLKKIQKYICANRAAIVNSWYGYFGF
jgi:hypothetical protein